MSDEWRTDASCLEYGADLFFPEEGSEAKSARTVCRGRAATKTRPETPGCPVAAQCLELGWWAEFGVYGGMTAKDRVRARQAARALRREAAA